MNDVQFVEIFNASYDLVKESASFWLFHSLVLNNVVEKLSSTSVLHDQIELLRSLNDLMNSSIRMPKYCKSTYFVELDDVRMSDQLEDVDFSGDSFDVRDILDFVFLKNFDCNL